MKNKTEIWEAIKRELVADVSAARVWLDGTELIFLGTTTAVIFVESDFARTVVQERFGERISDLLKNHCRHNVEVRFVGKEVRFSGNEEFFSIPTLNEQDEDSVLSSLTKLKVGFREVGRTLDALIAQLDCAIEEIQSE